MAMGYFSQCNNLSHPAATSKGIRLACLCKDRYKFLAVAIGIHHKNRNVVLVAQVRIFCIWQHDSDMCRRNQRALLADMSSQYAICQPLHPCILFRTGKSIVCQVIHNVLDKFRFIIEYRRLPSLHQIPRVPNIPQG